MAIIQCPSCGERISSAATTCQHCKSVFGDDEAMDKLERQARNRRLKRKASLQNYSFLAMMLFAAGAYLMYFGLGDSDELWRAVGTYLVAIGFVAYIGLRAALLWLKWR